MLYLINHGELLSPALELEPAVPEHWSRGQIVYFSMECAPLSDSVEEAILVDRTGSVWHVEIVATGPPRDPGSPARSGAIVRVLRTLATNTRVEALVNDHLNRVAVARFPGEWAGVRDQAGAA